MLKRLFYLISGVTLLYLVLGGVLLVTFCSSASDGGEDELDKLDTSKNVMLELLRNDLEDCNMDMTVKAGDKTQTLDVMQKGKDALDSRAVTTNGYSFTVSENGKKLMDTVYISPMSDYLTEMVAGIKFELVFVKGGTFQMGATSEQGSSYGVEERPIHEVTLSDYYIGKFEVTQGVWKAVMGSNPSYFQKGDDYPVEYVSWNDAQAFCTKLSQLTGKKYALPTEAQWEYAARGGLKSKGYKYSGSNMIDDVAWYDCSTGSYSTSPVGRKQANELGIYDMSGNVYEWCGDWYGSYCSDVQTDPTGPETGFDRVLRGGSWNIIARYCRVSNRYHINPSGKELCSGFRVVLLP